MPSTIPVLTYIIKRMHMWCVIFTIIFWYCISSFTNISTTTYNVHGYVFRSIQTSEWLLSHVWQKVCMQMPKYGPLKLLVMATTLFIKLSSRIVQAKCRKQLRQFRPRKVFAIVYQASNGGMLLGCQIQMSPRENNFSAKRIVEAVRRKRIWTYLSVA